jgi:hypothetical protein
MKCLHRSNRLAGLCAVTALAGAAIFLTAGLSAAEQTFATPEDAIQALRTAHENHDKSALRQIFGPDYDKLLTGDKDQDEKNADKFAAAMAVSCKPVPDGDDKMTLEVGANEWPMAIPLVKEGGLWHFDTAAGKEEIINRHIGKDEMYALGVCRAYVKAQQQYASQNAGPNGSYAQKLNSTLGKKDGLCWPSAENSADSPFSAAVAQAECDESVNNTSTGPQPFHGYFFRILSCQGPAAPGGKKSYMSEGHLAGGFALAAFPAHWDKSGIMTFIVNQDGKVYERNLGEKTSRLARKMKAYNPDDQWQLAEDEGVWKTAADQ